ncbi:MAG TPA: hypothetical protein VK879_07135 [Candidatus Sulfomarinibacteraceae bacterium]|nr:hypothetical protein [Candidatus Sulfomarinibacteraceae bacterium]
MPRLSALSIKLALLYLLVGFTFGQLMLINKGIPIHPELWRLLPAHIEFLLVGWTAQLALAVAHWIVPRFRGGDYGRPALAWLAIGLLNAGVLLTGLGPLFSLPPWVPFLGRLAEIAAVISFAVYIWPRVRPLGHQN